MKVKILQQSTVRDPESAIETVLVVDDDKLFLSFMGDFLSKAGYEVLTAPDGLSALDILETHTPQMIFLDLVMPGIDGKNLCRIIRNKETFRNVRMAILSGTLIEEPVDMAELGADACIAKGPFAEIVRSVLFVLREPDTAAAICSTGKIIGVEDVHPRIMTRQLLSLKKHFEMILEKISQEIVEITSEGRILFCNDAALSLFSIPEHELTGSPFAELFEGEERVRMEGFIKGLNGRVGTTPYETPVSLNGRMLTLEMLCHLDGGGTLFVIMTDTTEQMRERDSLISRERQLTQVIFNNSDAMVVSDREGIVQLVNLAGEVLFGRNADEFVGLPFGFPLASEETTELDVVTPSGRQRIVEMRVTETEWQEEPAYLASIRDITERSRMVDALETANRKILQQQETLVEEERLKVMLQMAGAAAHEFNQPLTVLLSNVDLIELDREDPDAFAKCLKDIKTSGRKIADIVKKVQNVRHYETKAYGKSGSIIDIDQDIHILSIEDSDDYFETIESVFEGIDRVNLVRAKTIADAISLLIEGEIDLALLDYELPDGNGFDFMEKAREKGIEIPVVILTGKGDEMIASRFIREGAFDYLTKAVFNGESISRCIWQVLEKTRLKREICSAQDKMARMAVTDALTGLHNRRYLFESLDREKKRAQRYGTDLVVCMIDLDHFKRINDDHGHPAGDAVLSDIGNLIERWARETDFPCRYGGEEFAVILPETTLEGGRMACERLRRMVAEHGFEYEALPLNVTISIGVAHYEKAAQQTVSDLVSKADEALYRAKQEGRNRVAVY